jgi:ADP-heptose:LPS heptosyltransferase
VVIGHSAEPIQLPKSEHVLDLINKTTLREMAAVLGKTKGLITTDSGPMHMGVAVRTPTLALFGPTTREFGFDPRFENCQVLQVDLDCRPCHVHGGNTCPLKHHKCLRDISVERVLQKAKALFQT